MPGAGPGRPSPSAGIKGTAHRHALPREGSHTLLAPSSDRQARPKSPARRVTRRCSACVPVHRPPDSTQTIRSCRAPRTASSGRSSAALTVFGRLRACRPPAQARRSASLRPGAQHGVARMNQPAYPVLPGGHRLAIPAPASATRLYECLPIGDVEPRPGAKRGCSHLRCRLDLEKYVKEENGLSNAPLSARYRVSRFRLHHVDGMAECASCFRRYSLGVRP